MDGTQQGDQAFDSADAVAMGEAINTIGDEALVMVLVRHSPVQGRGKYDQRGRPILLEGVKD